jgi:uncharacterized membrane protein
MSDEFENNDEFPEDDMPEMDEPASFEESTNDLDMDVSDDDKLWALLAYVLTPLIPIIIMLMADKKERPFLKAHNMQALIWGIILVVVGMVSSFLCGIPALLLWLVGCYWGYQAYQGKLVEIPVISGLVNK